MAILNERNLKELLDAFDHYFPGDTVYASDKKFKSFYGDYVWGNRKEFIDFIKRLTSVEIKNERDIANIKLAQAELVKLSGGVSEKDDSLDSNLPDEQARAQMEEERTKREKALNETKKQAEREVQESIKRKTETYQKQQQYQKIRDDLKNRIEEQKRVQTEISNKKIYAKVIPPEPEEASDNTKKFIEEAKKYPKSFRNEISSKLEAKMSSGDFSKNLSKEEIKIIVDKVANDTIAAINDPSGQITKAFEVAILKSINKDDVLLVETVGKEAKDFLGQASSEMSFINDSTLLSRNILSSFDKNLALSVFGPDPKDISVVFFAKQEKGVTHTIDLHQLNSGYGDFLSSQSQLFDRVGSFGQDQLQGFFLGQARTFLDGQIARLPADSLVSGFYNSSFGQQVLNLAGLTEYSPFAGNSFISFAQQIPGSAPIFEWVGSTFGIDFAAGAGAVAPAAEVAGATIAATEGTVALGGGATVATGIVATEAGTTLATGAVVAGTTTGAGAVVGAGGAAVGAGAGAAAGSVVPVLGTIAGAIVGFIGSIIPWDKVKKFLSEYGGVIAIALLGGGAIFGSVPMIAVGVPLLIASVPLAGGPTRFFSNIAGLLGILMTAFVFRAGKAVIITLLTVPIVVALILLIINSGAYVVPPNSSVFGNVSSPYIGITKEPSPPGPFENNELSKTITYNITITAKKSALTNVKINYGCQVISSSQSNCPSTSEIPTSVESISPSVPFSFSYTSTYDSKYSDSAIIDTISITADTTEQSGVSAETSASVTFGNPPISCPLPNGKPLNSMNYSYDSQANTGHGSTQYWLMMGAPYYRYSIPQQTSCDKPSGCSYYGYAYDVFPNGVQTVYVPTILGKSVTWNLTSTFNNPSSGHSLVYTDSTRTYTIILTHVDSTSAPRTATSGTKVNTLFNQGGNTHLHIEFQSGGRWVKPENYFCK